MKNEEDEIDNNEDHPEREEDIMAFDGKIEKIYVYKYAEEGGFYYPTNKFLNEEELYYPEDNNYDYLVTILKNEDELIEFFRQLSRESMDASIMVLFASDLAKIFVNSTEYICHTLLNAYLAELEILKIIISQVEEEKGDIYETVKNEGGLEDNLYLLAVYRLLSDILYEVFLLTTADSYEEYLHGSI